MINCHRLLPMKKIVLGIIFISIFLLITISAIAQTGYEIDWYSSDGGGTVSNGGEYSISGIAGQPDAGYVESGNYSIAGGFFSGSALTSTEIFIFLPLLTR